METQRKDQETDGAMDLARESQTANVIDISAFRTKKTEKKSVKEPVAQVRKRTIKAKKKPKKLAKNVDESIKKSKKTVPGTLYKLSGNTGENREIWENVLGKIAEDCNRVHRLRTGFRPNKSTWFADWSTERAQQACRDLTGLTPVGLAQFKTTYPFPLLSDAEALVVAGQLLARLWEPKGEAYRSIRAWFGSAKCDTGWFSGGIAMLNRLDFEMGAFSTTHLLEILDAYLEFVVEHCGLPNASIVQGHWSLAPLASIVRFSHVHRLHLQPVLMVLWQHALNSYAGTSCVLLPTADRLVGYLPKISHDRIQQMPRYDQPHLVKILLTLGLPGDTKLPDRLLFGLDFSKLERIAGYDPIALSESGQVIYRHAKSGQVLSEGHQVPLQPRVEGWGRSVQIWLTEANCDELLPHYKDPPERCPWPWYERWGNGAYGADGIAFRPDARYRPPVKWL